MKRYEGDRYCVRFPILEGNFVSKTEDQEIENTCTFAIKSPLLGPLTSQSRAISSTLNLRR